ncbi:hypothetical protein KWK86_004790 [Clostridioides difficile]|nr:hypothetical protein [Clostridioides difficile]
MYIDTHSRNSMEQSVCDFFNTSICELEKLFNMAGKEAQNDLSFDCQKFDNVINEFIEKKRPKDKIIDEILFFHLGRRLNTAQNCNIGNNLYDLLSGESAISSYLREHDVEFIPCDGHLDLIYKGREVSLEDTNRQYINYLRWRLGHNRNRIDYCFNGFAFKDLLYRNNYARALFGVPEFIERLGNFLKRNDILDDYLQNSVYYCFEYKLPLERVIFDDKPELPNEEKPVFLFNRVLSRLYDYYTRCDKYIFDHDNPIIRLSDNDTMPEKFYIAKNIITWDMLR